MGYVIAAEGLKADPPKIQGINEMPYQLNCKQDVERLLGMLNYLQRFATDLSELTTSIIDLLNEDVHFQLEAALEQKFYRH